MATTAVHLSDSKNNLTVINVDETNWYTTRTKHCQDAKPVEICRGSPKLANRYQPLVAEVHHIVRACGGAGEILVFNKLFSDCRYVP